MILISPSIALLFDREFTHSRKCLEVPIHEKIGLAEIYGVYSIPSFCWPNLGGKTSLCHVTAFWPIL